LGSSPVPQSPGWRKLVQESDVLAQRVIASASPLDTVRVLDEHLAPGRIVVPFARIAQSRAAPAALHAIRSWQLRHGGRGDNSVTPLPVYFRVAAHDGVLLETR
jgi:hypothetical protein